jgi:CarD family transcriptional regulator
MLKLKQVVVYPGQGIGIIEKIESRDILGIKQKYYIVAVVEKKMKIMVPFKKAEEFGLRRIMDTKALAKVFRIFKERRKTRTEKDWKLRYQANLDKLKSGTNKDLAEVIRDLNHRKKKDDLSVMEKKLFENAFNSLVAEICIIKKVEREDAEKLIIKNLK